MLYPTELVIYHLAWWLTGSIYWQRAGVHEYRLCPFSQNNFVLMPVIGVRFQSFPSQTPEMLLTWNIIGVAKSRFFTWANTVKCHLSLRPTPSTSEICEDENKRLCFSNNSNRPFPSSTGPLYQTLHCSATTKKCLSVKSTVVPVLGRKKYKGEHIHEDALPVAGPEYIKPLSFY